MLSELDKEILSLTKRKSTRNKDPFVCIEPLETRIVNVNFFSTVASLSTRNMLLAQGEVYLGVTTGVLVRLTFLGDLMLRYNDVHQSMKDFNLVARYYLTRLRHENYNPDFLKHTIKIGVDSHYYVEDVLNYLQVNRFINRKPVDGGTRVGNFGTIEITHRGISALLTKD